MSTKEALVNLGISISLMIVQTIWTIHLWSQLKRMWPK